MPLVDDEVEGFEIAFLIESDLPDGGVIAVLTHGVSHLVRIGRADLVHGVRHDLYRGVSGHYERPRRIFALGLEGFHQISVLRILVEAGR